MAVYPTDLEHPRVHVVWSRTIILDAGKIVILAAYKTYPAYPQAADRNAADPNHKVLASITVSTYDDATKPQNYTGAILADRQFKHPEMAEAEVRAVNWLSGLHVVADWGQQ